VARVNFTYLPAHDGNCNNGNPSVVFSVAPWTSGGACAFFPSGGGCVPRTVVINFPDLDNNYGTIAPNVRTVGVFRHELGHVLGLRHEHTRPEAGVCFENSAWRAVSPYDQASVMHYPWCNGVTASDLSITPYDALGAALLYGGDPANLAASKPATQSSTLADGDASRAVDGNTDGLWSNRSITHTALQAQPWWQVDLGAVADIGEVILYNRADCCSDRLADLDILLSSDGSTWSTAAGLTGVAPARAVLAVNAAGRFVRVRLRGTNYLSLAEVQVRPRNLARNKAAAQSSTVLGAAASRAVDGNPDGAWTSGSVTHTDFEAQPWWQVDLGAVTEIGQVVLHNRTDCCGDRLASFDIQLSSDGSAWQNAAGLTGAAPDRVPFAIAAAARYVRVRLRGTNYLSLAEVEVFPPLDLARAKAAAQSSTDFGGSAARAVDGNTDGAWGNNSVTHTGFEAQPWWQVDLGAVRGIGQVILHNRTDCCGERLADLDVQLSNDGGAWQNAAGLTGPAGVRRALPIRAAGRFVRVRLRGANYLSLAELQAIAP
jgi:hypothetical protein